MGFLYGVICSGAVFPSKIMIFTYFRAPEVSEHVLGMHVDVKFHVESIFEVSRAIRALLSELGAKNSQKSEICNLGFR